MIAFAKALEVIPRQLCDNSGFDATDVLNKLRQKHALKDGSGKNFGVNVNTGMTTWSTLPCLTCNGVSTSPALLCKKGHLLICGANAECPGLA